MTPVTAEEEKATEEVLDPVALKKMAKREKVKEQRRQRKAN